MGKRKGHSEQSQGLPQTNLGKGSKGVRASDTEMATGLSPAGRTVRTTKAAVTLHSSRL